MLALVTHVELSAYPYNEPGEYYVIIHVGEGYSPLFLPQLLVTGIFCHR